MRQINIVHLTSVHNPDDVRIFQKQCKSLAMEGYHVTLIAPHVRDESIEGIYVKAVSKCDNRLSRMTRTVWRVYREAALQNADIYHFHDPELIPAGLALRAAGKKVIYDAHEAMPQNIMCKPWIPSRLRPIVSRLFGFFERLSARVFNHIITADRFTASAFTRTRVSVVHNYPDLQLSESRIREAREIPNKFVMIYVGGLTDDRGLKVMLDVARLLQRQNVELHLLGKFLAAEDERRARELPNVRYFGFRPRSIVYEHLMYADVGLVLLQPVPAYSYHGESTTKLFEYMSCGLPVISSNFPNLKSIVQGDQCGICVDPQKADEVAKGVLFLMEQPGVRSQFGRNGHKAVMETYNWNRERATLLRVYRELVGEQDIGQFSPGPRYSTGA